jgi:tetratricopeptide (TPR) repeat protein
LVQEQQRFGEAEKLYRRAIRIFEAAFGPIHYELGVNYNNLVALHAARGNLREAKNLYQRALDIKQRLLGHNHPDVAMTLHNLAMLYTQQGDNDRARAIRARVGHLRIQPRARTPEDRSNQNRTRRTAHSDTPRA